jgi:hypothetical protein
LNRCTYPLSFFNPTDINYVFLVILIVFFAFISIDLVIVFTEVVPSVSN